MIVSSRRSRLGSPSTRPGFTLIELLVVILIILLVSAVALPTVLPAWNARQVSEAGRALQGALVGARDRAIHDGQPSGIRLLPDPAFPLQWVNSAINTTLPLAYNRILPIGAAPEYTEGYCTVVPQAALNNAIAGNSYTYPNTSVTFAWATIPKPPNGLPPELILVESPVDPGTGFANSPTSWFWNVRVGDKIQLGGTGPWYTVIGPILNGPAAGNAERFVNLGAPGAIASNTGLPTINGVHVEYLALVNGRDDNNNGFIDDGWDGVDNNGNGYLDEFQFVNGNLVSEWETETWQGAAASTTLENIPYTIRRRPAPLPGAREIALPTSMVIDATTWANAGSQERSRLPVDPYSGIVDILLNPDGTVLYNSPYGTPSSFGMADTFYHFWIGERQDVAAPNPNQTAAPYLPVAPGVTTAAGITTSTPDLKGNYSVLTLFARTGQIAVNENPPFLFNSGAGYNAQVGTYNANNPFIPAEQGIRGAP